MCLLLVKCLDNRCVEVVKFSHHFCWNSLMAFEPFIILTCPGFDFFFFNFQCFFPQIILSYQPIPMMRSLAVSSWKLYHLWIFTLSTPHLVWLWCYNSTIPLIVPPFYFSFLLLIISLNLWTIESHLLKALSFHSFPSPWTHFAKLYPWLNSTFYLLHSCIQIANRKKKTPHQDD